MRIGERSAHGDQQVLVERLVVFERNIDAAVLHLTQIAVGRDARKAHRRGQRTPLHEDAGTIFLVNVDVQRQGVEQSQFKSYVKFGALLPRGQGIAHGLDLVSGLLDEVGRKPHVERLVHVDRREIGETDDIVAAVGQIVVARKTVRSTDFQQVHLAADTFPERFARHDPRSGDRGEKPETTTRYEVLRAVVAEVELHQVAVVIPIGKTSGETLLAVRKHLVLIIGGLIVDLLLLVVDEQGVDVVFAERARIFDLPLQRDLTVTVPPRGGSQIGRSGRADALQVVVESPVAVVGIVGHFVIIGRKRTVSRRIGLVVERDHAPNLQSLGDEIEVLVHREGRGDVLRMALSVSAAQQGIRIDVRRTTVPRRGISENRVVEILHGAFGIDGRESDRIGAHRIVEQVFHLFDGTVPEKQLRVHLQTHAGRSGELRADVGLEKVFLRIDVGVEFRLRGLLQDTVFVEDRSIEEIVDHLAAAPHIEIHVLVDRKILEKHRIPVIVGIDVGIEPVARARDLLVRKVLHISFARRGAGAQRLVVVLHVSHAVGDVLHARRHRNARLETNVDRHLLRLAAVFGGNDHYAVGAARTVERRGRGVAQDRKRLDRLGRNVVEHLRDDLHAVENQQRRFVSPEGRDAANPEIRTVGAGFARRLGRDDAGDLARERGREVARRHLERTGTHDLHGSHQTLLLLRAEGHDHHVVHDVRRLDQRHELEQFDIGDGDLLGVVAQKSEGDVFRSRRHLEGVVAVDVRGGADGRPLDIDRNTDDGLVVGRRDHRPLQDDFPTGIRSREGGGDGGVFPSGRFRDDHLVFAHPSGQLRSLEDRGQQFVDGRRPDRNRNPAVEQRPHVVGVNEGVAAGPLDLGKDARQRCVLHLHGQRRFGPGVLPGGPDGLEIHRKQQHRRRKNPQHTACRATPHKEKFLHK